VERGEDYAAWEWRGRVEVYGLRRLGIEGGTELHRIQMEGGRITDWEWKGRTIQTGNGGGGQEYTDWELRGGGLNGLEMEGGGIHRLGMEEKGRSGKSTPH